METIQSLDPRISRASLSGEDIFTEIKDAELFDNYEVFHQAKTGTRHIHVGSVHAPNQEMAYLFAKEQFGRRMQTTSLWVVKTTDIYTMADDEVLFATATSEEKEYRNANIWKVREKIDKFKKEQGNEIETPQN